MDDGSQDESFNEIETDYDSSQDGSISTTAYSNSDSGIGLDFRSSTPESYSPMSFDFSDNITQNFTGVNALCEMHHAFINQAAFVLSKPDICLLQNSCGYLFQICKCGYTSFLLYACPNILTYIRTAILSNSVIQEEPELLHCLSGVIYYISQTEEGLNLFVKGDDIFVFTPLLAFPIESVLFYCLTAIHNLLLNRNVARENVRRSNALGHLVLLLKISVAEYMQLSNCLEVCYSLTNLNTDLPGTLNPKFLAILCDCLYLLSYGDTATKCAIRNEGGIPALLRILHFSTYDKLLWTASRLLRVLSAWSPAKIDIIDSDTSLEFIRRCLSSSYVHFSKVTPNALWTLRNLSDVAVGR
ncbi:unnamed protein product, partial [Protopolystoma xenopodis]